MDIDGQQSAELASQTWCVSSLHVCGQTYCTKVKLSGTINGI